jgi:tetraacyldisaccharide 4'-kinase
MRFLRFIFFPFALIYWCITGIRNFFYKKGIMKASRFNVTAISVGNLSMGGTGKSPHVEYLIRLLKNDYKVATLSRGFGRRERGFKIADESATAMSIGDEPLQFYKKFGSEITVAVEANRVLGAMDLFRVQPEINVLLLDDAYQHRAIHRDLNILLTDYNYPFHSDFILPVGNLRESKSGKKRAEVVIVTKCPPLSDQEKAELMKKLKLRAEQKLFFSSIQYGDVIGFKEGSLDLSNRKIVLVTGIAKPLPLEEYISESNQILKHFNYPDHHKFRAEELNEIHNFIDKFAAEKPIVLCTEKDAMRLMCAEFETMTNKYSWAYQTIQVKLDREEEFKKEVLSYVEKNN